MSYIPSIAYYDSFLAENRFSGDVATRVGHCRIRRVPGNFRYRSNSCAAAPSGHGLPLSSPFKIPSKRDGNLLSKSSPALHGASGVSRGSTAQCMVSHLAVHVVQRLVAARQGKLGVGYGNRSDRYGRCGKTSSSRQGCRSCEIGEAVQRSHQTNPPWRKAPTVHKAQIIHKARKAIPICNS